MIFELSKFILDVDVDKTRKFYDTALVVSKGCSCDGCRNYERSVDTLPKNITSFFAQFGIEMKKVREVYVNCANADGTLHYGGFYHLCGKIIKGECAWVSTGPNASYWDTEKTHAISNDFKVSFSDKCDLLELGFPLPAIQIEIEADIPWVLEEKHGYPKDTSRRK